MVYRELTDQLEISSSWLRFVVRGSLRMAELGKAIEEYVGEVHQCPDPAQAEARYLRELQAEAEHLCSAYGKEKTMETFREVLGEQKYQLYFGQN